MSLTKSASVAPLSTPSTTKSRTDESWQGKGSSLASYHEMGYQHVIRHDELELLHLQLSQLEDLVSRIGFISRELRQSLKIK